MSWDPRDVAYDGVFCDAFGQATDGYFCLVERRPPIVVLPAAKDQGLRDKRDLQDLLHFLAKILNQ